MKLYKAEGTRKCAKDAGLSEHEVVERWKSLREGEVGGVVVRVSRRKVLLGFSSFFLFSGRRRFSGCRGHEKARISYFVRIKMFRWVVWLELKEALSEIATSKITLRIFCDALVTGLWLVVWRGPLSFTGGDTL
jgi:hypothetical protein